MTDPLIHDMDLLMRAFNASTPREAAQDIEEAAHIDDGRIVTIDDIDPDEVHLVVDTRGMQIVFPTTTSTILHMAEEIEQMMEDEDS